MIGCEIDTKLLFPSRTETIPQCGWLVSTHVDVCAVGKEELGDSDVPVPRCDMDRGGLLRPGPTVHVGASGEQRADAGTPVSRHCRVESRAPASDVEAGSRSRQPLAPLWIKNERGESTDWIFGCCHRLAQRNAAGFNDADEVARGTHLLPKSNVIGGGGRMLRGLDAGYRGIALAIIIVVRRILERERGRAAMRHDGIPACSSKLRPRFRGAVPFLGSMHSQLLAHDRGPVIQEGEDHLRVTGACLGRQQVATGGVRARSAAHARRSRLAKKC